MAERRSLLSSEDIARALFDIERMVAHAVDTEAAIVSARQALATARAFRLLAYDAVYLDRHNSGGCLSQRSMSACGRRLGKPEWNWFVEEYSRRSDRLMGFRSRSGWHCQLSASTSFSIRSTIGRRPAQNIPSWTTNAPQ